LAPRAAVLTAIALLATGCLKPPRDAASVPACGGCHEPHYTAQGRCEECHRGDPAATRQELAHAWLLTGGAAEHALPDGPVVREGRQLVERLACRRCHTIAGEGNRLSTELDAVVWKREQAQLALSITQPVENMPDFGLEPRQIEAVIAYLLSAGSRDKPLDSYRVHFERAGADRTSVFEDKCGGCHRFLSPQGARGRGSAGPNLSGLFTPLYPRTAEGDRPWTAQALADWVKNPRHVRRTTTMPPLALSEDELRRVTEELAEVR
jgi:cytochrome c2